MGQCLVKIAHSCGTRDGLQVFEQEDGSLDGFCFSCKKRVSDPLGMGKTAADIPQAQRLRKTKEEIAEEIEEISGYDTIDLPDRRLRKDILEVYGVKVGVSEQDGKTPAFQYFPYYKGDELTSYKVKLLEGKKFWSVGDQKDVDLFGWKQAKTSGARRLIITEGENDAIALAKIFEIYEKADYKDTIPAICSLPHGSASAAKDVSRLLPEIRKHFKEISLCFDNDQAGEKALEDVCRVLPEAQVITLPLKDANQCLIEGKGRAAYNAAKWKAEKKKNTRLVFGEDMHEAAREPAKYGELTWPWEGLNGVTRGIRYGETIYVGAGVKMGGQMFSPCKIV